MTRQVMTLEEDAKMREVNEGLEIMQRGMMRNKMRGGQGDQAVANVNGSVLTVAETLAVKIAQDMITDCERRHKKPLAELNLIELNEGMDLRCKGRQVKPNQVGAEIARLQNQAKYGDTVARR